MGALLSWVDSAGTAHEHVFDLVTEEQVELTSQATEHPVEDGANIADHVRKELDRITLEVFVTQTPITLTNGRRGSVRGLTLNVPKFTPPFAPTPGAVFSAAGKAIRNAFASVDPPYEAQVLQFDEPFDNVAETLRTLEKIRDDYTLVEIVLPFKSFDSMHLETISLVSNADTGTGSAVRLAFKELRKVAVRIVNAPIPTEIRGATSKPKGAQSTKEVPPGKLKTDAKALVDRLRGKK